MLNNLTGCALFRGLSAEEVDRALHEYGYQTRAYAKGDIIGLQGSRYGAMLILTEGRIKAETTDSQHHTISVEYVSSPSLVAPSYLFSENNSLPVTLAAAGPVTVLVIPKDDFLEMISSDRRMLQNFLAIVSSSNKFISEKVVYLNYKTIKSKLANYLLNLMDESGSTTLRNKLTQREMAELFGVTRPALARTIGELAEEGTIYVKGKEITILFEEKLRHHARS